MIKVIENKDKIIKLYKYCNKFWDANLNDNKEDYEKYFNLALRLEKEINYDTTNKTWCGCGTLIFNLLTNYFGSGDKIELSKLMNILEILGYYKGEENE